MSEGRRYFSCYIVALLLLSSSENSPAAEAVAQKAHVFGTPTANLRAGAGVEHALKLTLKEGDPVTIEKLEGEWFLVTTASGEQGYIHKNLLKPVENVTVQRQIAPQQESAAIAKPVPVPPSGSAQSVPSPATTATKPPARSPAVALVETAKTTSGDGKAPSLLQMLEGRETEVKIALLVAAIAFLFGWICGGHYYIRREHRYRRRLRL